MGIILLTSFIVFIVFAVFFHLDEVYPEDEE